MEEKKEEKGDTTSIRKIMGEMGNSAHVSYTTHGVVFQARKTRKDYDAESIKN